MLNWVKTSHLSVRLSFLVLLYAISFSPDIFRVAKVAFGSFQSANHSDNYFFRGSMPLKNLIFVNTNVKRIIMRMNLFDMIFFYE